MSLVMFQLPDLRGRRWANPNEDLRLISESSIDDLDVERTEEGLQLKKLTFGDKARRFFHLSDEQGRLRRLREYVEAAERSAPDIIKRDDLKAFYRGLRKWQILDLRNLSESVRFALSPEMRGAVLTYQAAERALAAANKAKAQDEIEVHQGELVHAEWNMKRAEVMLAHDLGIEFERAGSGVNGALFGRGLDGRRLLVIKKIGHDTRPKILTEWVVGERTQPQICNNDARISGAVSCMIDRYFGFGLVPFTDTDKDDYSYQEYIYNSQNASVAKMGSAKALLKDRPASDFTESEIEMLQSKVLFNYLTGDLDGKDDKLFVRLNEKGEIVELFETDNDNTFPENELTSEDLRTIMKNQWKDHLWAKLPFKLTPKLIAIFEKITNEFKLSKFAALVADKYPGFWTVKRMELFLQRAAIIKMCVDLKYSPFVLGTIYGSEMLKAPEFSKELALVHKNLGIGPLHSRAFDYARSFDDEYEAKKPE
ncbi:MAG: hypothetical protein K1X28_04565 [Parachlamydiales bacterium]|nr:hypothetical protein [Parachlamydiales bacterium]